MPGHRASSATFALAATSLALACAAPPPPAPAPARPIALTIVWLAPSQQVATAASALSARDYPRTVEHASAALAMELAPADRAAALEQLCVAYPMVGEPDRAIDHCEALLAQAPDDWRVLNNLGNAHLHAHRLLRAIDYYRRALAALQTDPGHAPRAHHVQSGQRVRGIDLVSDNLERALRRLRDGPPERARPPTPAIG